MRLLSDLPTVTDSQRGALMRSFPFPDRTIDGKACNIPESCQIEYGKTRGRAFALDCLTPPCADASAQSIFHLAFDFSQRFPSFSSPIKHVLFFPTPLSNSKCQYFHHRVSSSGKLYIARRPPIVKRPPPSVLKPSGKGGPFHANFAIQLVRKSCAYFKPAAVLAHLQLSQALHAYSMLPAYSMQAQCLRMIDSPQVAYLRLFCRSSPVPHGLHCPVCHQIRRRPCP
ncbi:hypothetical protein CRV24_005171 [Beauveria bassiana]|nr:hypothetical protein CRV24_005171 [Beauveria bassiana]